MNKILIVEDDKKIESLLVKNLEKWNYEGKGINDFSQVIKEFTEFNPSLVLMDINLPLYDGYHWCNKIRDISKVPIIFISSRENNMDIIMAMNMGADDYVTKPFSIDILLAKINSIIRRTYKYSVASVSVITYGDITLNMKDNTVLYKNDSIELTKNEFKILEVLMSKSKTIVSREEIMRVLWEHESFIDDNTLTVNINRLRKKLKEINLDNLINTKKGQGYILK